MGDSPLVTMLTQKMLNTAEALLLLLCCSSALPESAFTSPISYPGLHLGHRGEASNPLHHESDKLGQWELVEEAHNPKTATRISKFRSPVLSLSPGHIINTDAANTTLRMPAGHIFVTSFAAEIVDANNRSVPLHDVYLHHWIINNGRGNAGPCDTLSFVMGVGAESRNSPTVFGDGYGLECNGKEDWTANIHVLNTKNDQYCVENVKACIECDCPLNGGAGVSCCPDKGVCAGVTPWADCLAESAKQNFYLQYVVEYTNAAAAAISPVDVHVMSVSNCNVEYNIPSQCAWWTLHTHLDASKPISPLNKPKLGLYYPWEIEGQDCKHTLASRVDIPAGFNSSITTAIGHLHIGGVEIKLSLQDDTAPEGRRELCTSTARYGSTLDSKGTDAGDELGYLVAMSRCDFSDSPVNIKGGDVLYMESTYLGNVPRNGVMGYFILAAANHGGSTAIRNAPLVTQLI